MSERTILVTGGAGFIGSNFINYYLNKYPDSKIINLDLLTYAANPSYIAEFPDDRYILVKGSICDSSLINKIFKDNEIHDIIHFAAESHVDNSIEGPQVFIETNILGTFLLLDKAKNEWLDKDFNVKEKFKSSRFHHISTDEVYGTLGSEGLFTETTPYAPNSPYSASKASSDHLVRSYNRTYGLNTTITNCSNNYGPHQHDEKLIPTIIRNCLKENPIPVYGKGENIRDWLFVVDHCKAIDLVFHEGKSGETYNVGGDNEICNIDLVHRICNLLDQKVPRENGQRYSELISFVKDRPGHDLRYAIDSTKIQNELSFKEISPFDQALDFTIDWYLKKYL